MSSLFIEKKKKDFIGKTTFVFKPAFGTKEADYELLSFSEKKSSLNNFSRVDLFLFFNHLSQRGTSFSGAIRGVLYVASKYTPQNILLSEIEKASYLLDLEGEVGSDINRASKIHSFDAIKASFYSETEAKNCVGTYFSLLKSIGVSSLDSKLSDELKEIFDFLDKNSNVSDSCLGIGLGEDKTGSYKSKNGLQEDIDKDNTLVDALNKETKNKESQNFEYLENDDFSEFLVGRSPFFRALSGMSGVLPEGTKHIDTSICGSEQKETLKRFFVPHSISAEAFPSVLSSSISGVSRERRVQYGQKISTFKTKTIRIRWNIQ